MAEYRMLGPDECPDHRLGDEANVEGSWSLTGWRGGLSVAALETAYRRPIKQEDRPVTEFRVGDVVSVQGIVEKAGYRPHVNFPSLGGCTYEVLEQSLTLTAPVTTSGIKDVPVVKEPSPYHHNWFAFGDGTYILHAATEEKALEWFESLVNEDNKSYKLGDVVLTLYKEHATRVITAITHTTGKPASINKQVE